MFHTNISSLSANFEKLELLLYELNFKFDIIVLTETWNSETRKHLFNPGLLLGYLQYEGLTGNSMKSGCGFYIAQNCHTNREQILTASIMMNSMNFKPNGLK